MCPSRLAPFLPTLSTSTMAPVLLVRRPPTSLASGILSHIEDHRDSIDYRRALQQWQAYTQAYKERGWQVKEIEHDDALPDSVFVEDGVVFVGSADGTPDDGVFILASPGNVAREGEVAGIEKALNEDRCSSHRLVRIEKPGTLDGGDVLKVPSKRTIYVGRSQRTNEEGVRQFTAHVSKLGWQVTTVPVKKALHLSASGSFHTRRLGLTIAPHARIHADCATRWNNHWLRAAARRQQHLCQVHCNA